MGFLTKNGKFNGIITEYYPDYSHYTENGNLLGTPVEVNSGLSFVISASAVEEMLDNL